MSLSVSNMWASESIAWEIERTEAVILESKDELETYCYQLKELSPIVTIELSNDGDINLHFQVTDFLTKEIKILESVVNVRKAIAGRGSILGTGVIGISNYDKDFYDWKNSVRQLIHEQFTLLHDDWKKDLVKRLQEFSRLSVWMDTEKGDGD